MSRLMIAVLAFAPATMLAQKAPACLTPSPKAAWVVAQREATMEKAGSWANDSLRKGLMSAAAMQRDTLALQVGWALHVDPASVSGNETIDYLTKLGAVRGAAWPLRSVVGTGGSRAVYYLANRDTALLRTALKHMMEGGPEEGIKPDIAMLEDLARTFAGRKQLYGTQMKVVNGRVIPLAIEDSAHADLRREVADLPPLAWSVCNATASLKKK